MIRALPVLIIFMVIMIASKLLEIMEIAPDYFGPKVIRAAEEKKAVEEKKEAAPESAEKVQKAEKSEEHHDVADDKQKPEQQKIYFSPTEVDVLQELSNRRQQLDAREQEILVKEQSLEVIEKNIQDKIANLQVLQEKLQTILAAYEKKEDEKYKSLVKVYEAMKPVESAKICEQLQMDILIEVAIRMKEPKLALILAKMDSAKAKELTVELANRRKVIDVN